MAHWHYYSFHDWSIGNKHIFLDLRWQITQKNTHPIVYNAGKKGQHSVPPFQFPKFVLGQPWEAFPVCGILVGFWWGFGWLLVVLIVNYLGFGFSSAHFWDFGVLVGLNGNQLVLVYSHVWWHWPIFGILVGFWWGFDGVEWKSIGFSHSHVWWHWPIVGILVGFWWGFDGVEWKSIGFSRSHVWWHWPIFGILVVFWWGYSCVLIMFYWQPSRNVMGFL